MIPSFIWDNLMEKIDEYVAARVEVKLAELMAPANEPDQQLMSARADVMNAKSELKREVDDLYRKAEDTVQITQDLRRRVAALEYSLHQRTSNATGDYRPYIINPDTHTGGNT